MLWVKAFHIVFMVTWFAGLFYLPRLFVYHAEATDPIGLERFVLMERRLLGIMTIGGALTVLLGLWMLAAYAWEAYHRQLWLHLKLVLVGLLILYHLQCWRLARAFAAGRNRHSSRYYRLFNELPGLLLVAIVVLVVVRPF
ncbi:MAG: CopD family protein [Gammaproteobacteria bacterium]|nr:MAG: CopD family protein [Gammaproteobacteria bacterium]